MNILQGCVLRHHDHVVPLADGVVAAWDQNCPVPPDDPGDQDAGLQLQFPQGGIRQRHALVHMEFQRFHRAAHQPVQGLDPGTGGAFHGPDILDNQLRGHIPHGHHAVDHPLAADQLRQRAAVDLGHHLALLRLAGGAHGHEDVGLVDARQGHEGVRLLNALLRQQFAVGAVSLDHQRPRQLLADLSAAGLVLVDDLHAHAHVQQLVCQIVAHLAGSHDHHRGSLFPEHPQILEKRRQLIRRGGDIDLIPGFQPEIAGGNGGLPFPGHRADQHPRPGVFVKIQQLHAVQRRPFRQAVLHQFQPPLGEGFQLHGRREPQHAGDLMGRGLFRVDGHGKAQLSPHEPQLRLIFRVADAGDGMGHPQLLCHQTGKNVDLVAGGGGDQEIGLTHLRLFLHLIAGAVAADAHHIINVDDIFNEARLLIDNRHPVSPDQLRGKAGANLARAYNNDLHIAPFRRTAPT